MKKILCFLLAGVLMLSFASCNKTENGASSVASVSSVSESDENSSASEESNPPPVNPQLVAVDAALGEAPDRSIGRRNILYGLTYTASRPENDTYNDPSHVKLTDGVAVTDFNTYSWVGYDGGTAVTLNFDLGEEVAGIADIEIGCFRQIEYSIGTPQYVEIYISDDGENFTRLSRLYAPSDMLSVQKYTFNLALQGVVSARYLRLIFGPQDSGFLFLDEIAAYVYDGTEEDVALNSDYYECGLPEKVTEDRLWPSDTANGNDEINLALEAKTYFSQYSAIPTASCVSSNNTPVSESTLNDGVYAPIPSWETPAMTRFTRGDGRDVIYDLGYLSAVRKIRGAALSQTEWGVSVPITIVVSLSANGTDWQAVKTFSLYDTEKSGELVYFEGELGKTFAARFVRFSFALNPHVAITELEVIGTKTLPSAVSSVKPDSSEESYASHYLTPENADGIRNILCVPISSGTLESFDFNYAMNTVEDYLPYVGYYEDGVLKDTFMDAFLFSPTSRYVNEEARYTLAGWKHYLEAQFLEGYNLSALNEAVGQVSSGLSLEDYKGKIFLSVLRTFPYLNAEGTIPNTFGDIDGDGVDDPLTDPENRKKAIRWMIDTQLERYAREGYEHLQIAGFYWHEESIINTDEHEIELLEYAVNYIHELGYKVLWIPYYKAIGFDKWEEYGIDYACLQPNYSFMAVPQDDRLDAAARLAKLYGMCVEIECGDSMNPDAVIKYKEYLANGVKYGYMNAVKVYYLDALPGELIRAQESENSYIRAIYRDTYLFAKEKLPDDYQVISENTEHIAPADSEQTVQSGKNLYGTLEAENAEIHSVFLSLLPRYGSLKLNRDGSFIYYAPKDFSGTDTFRVQFVYPDGKSEEATVTIHIEG